MKLWFKSDKSAVFYTSPATRAVAIVTISYLFAILSIFKLITMGRKSVLVPIMDCILSDIFVGGGQPL